MTSSPSSRKRVANIPEQSEVPQDARPVAAPWTAALFWLWVAGVALVAMLQPVELGFYLDDWSIAVDGAHHGNPFSPERFAHQYSVDPSRPSIAPVRFALSSALQDVTFRWQLALVLANAAVALLLALLLRRLVDPARRVPERAYIAFALSWLVLPWAAAVRFWPVMLPVLVIFVPFAAMLVWVVREWQRGRAPIVWPALVYLFACTAYEGFYLQCLPPALIGCALCFGKRARWRDVARTCAGLFAAQALALGWYFASGKLTKAQKPVNTEWLTILATNLVRLVPDMIGSAYETYILLTVGAVGLIATIVFGLVKAPEGGIRSIATELMLAAACLIAFPLSLVAYSLGDRRVATFGIETRIMLFASFWFVAGVALLTVAATRYSDAARKSAVLCASVSAFALLLSGVGRLGDWGTAWHLTQKVLAEAPVEKMAALPPGSEVLYVGPTNVIEAPVLQSSWDINKAMPITHPATAKLHFTPFWQPLSPLQWDGSTLRYGRGEFAGQASTLYIWQPEWRQFYRAPGPFSVARDGAITYW